MVLHDGSECALGSVRRWHTIRDAVHLATSAVADAAGATAAAAAAAVAIAARTAACAMPCRLLIAGKEWQMRLAVQYNHLLLGPGRVRREGCS